MPSSSLNKVIDNCDHDILPSVLHHEEENMRQSLNFYSELKQLSLEQLTFLFKRSSNYLSEICNGAQFSQRHADFMKGGQAKKLLKHTIPMNSFTDNQHDHIMELLVKHPSLVDIQGSNPQYVAVVALPEIYIKMGMLFYGLGYQDTVKKMV